MMKIRSRLFFWFLVASNFCILAAAAPLAFAFAYPISRHTTLFLPNDRQYSITPLLMSGTTVFRSSSDNPTDAVEVWVTSGRNGVVPTATRVRRDWNAMVKSGSKVGKDAGCKKSRNLVYSCQRTYQDGRVQIGFWNQLRDVVNLEIAGNSMKSKKMAAWSRDVVLAPVRFRR